MIQIIMKARSLTFIVSVLLACQVNAAPGVEFIAYDKDDAATEYIGFDKDELNNARNIYTTRIRDPATNLKYIGGKGNYVEHSYINGPGGFRKSSHFSEEHIKETNPVIDVTERDTEKSSLADIQFSERPHIHEVHYIKHHGIDDGVKNVKQSQFSEGHKFVAGTNFDTESDHVPDLATQNSVKNTLINTQFRSRPHTYGIDYDEQLNKGALPFKQSQPSETNTAETYFNVKTNYDIDLTTQNVEENMGLQNQPVTHKIYYVKKSITDDGVNIPQQLSEGHIRETHSDVQNDHISGPALHYGGTNSVHNIFFRKQPHEHVMQYVEQSSMGDGIDLERPQITKDFIEGKHLGIKTDYDKDPAIHRDENHVLVKTNNRRWPRTLGIHHIGHFNIGEKDDLIAGPKFSEGNSESIHGSGGQKEYMTDISGHSVMGNNFFTNLRSRPYAHKIYYVGQSNVKDEVNIPKLNKLNDGYIEGKYRGVHSDRVTDSESYSDKQKTLLNTNFRQPPHVNGIQYGEDLEYSQANKDLRIEGILYDAQNDDIVGTTTRNRETNNLENKYFRNRPYALGIHHLHELNIHNEGNLPEEPQLNQEQTDGKHSLAYRDYALNTVGHGAIGNTLFNTNLQAQPYVHEIIEKSNTDVEGDLPKHSLYSEGHFKDTYSDIQSDHIKDTTLVSGEKYALHKTNVQKLPYENSVQLIEQQNNSDEADLLEHAHLQKISYQAQGPPSPINGAVVDKSESHILFNANLRRRPHSIGIHKSEQFNIDDESDIFEKSQLSQEHAEGIYAGTHRGSMTDNTGYSSDLQEGPHVLGIKYVGYTNIGDENIPKQSQFIEGHIDELYSGAQDNIVMNRVSHNGDKNTVMSANLQKNQHAHQSQDIGQANVVSGINNFKNSQMRAKLIEEMSAGELINMPNVLGTFAHKDDESFRKRPNTHSIHNLKIINAGDKVNLQEQIKVGKGYTEVGQGFTKEIYTGAQRDYSSDISDHSGAKKPLLISNFQDRPDVHGIHYVKESNTGAGLHFAKKSQLNEGQSEEMHSSPQIGQISGVLNLYDKTNTNFRERPHIEGIYDIEQANVNENDFLKQSQSSEAHINGTYFSLPPSHIKNKATNDDEGKKSFFSTHFRRQPHVNEVHYVEQLSTDGETNLPDQSKVNEKHIKRKFSEEPSGQIMGISTVYPEKYTVFNKTILRLPNVHRIQYIERSNMDEMNEGYDISKQSKFSKRHILQAYDEESDHNTNVIDIHGDKIDRLIHPNLERIPYSTAINHGRQSNIDDESEVYASSQVNENLIGRSFLDTGNDDISNVSTHTDEQNALFDTNLELKSYALEVNQSNANDLYRNQIHTTMLRGYPRFHGADHIIPPVIKQTPNKKLFNFGALPSHSYPPMAYYNDHQIPYHNYRQALPTHDYNFDHYYDQIPYYNPHQMAYQHYDQIPYYSYGQTPHHHHDQIPYKYYNHVPYYNYDPIFYHNYDQTPYNNYNLNPNKKYDQRPYYDYIKKPYHIYNQIPYDNYDKIAHHNDNQRPRHSYNPEINHKYGQQLYLNRGKMPHHKYNHDDYQKPYYGYDRMPNYHPLYDWPKVYHNNNLGQLGGLEGIKYQELTDFFEEDNPEQYYEENSGKQFKSQLVPLDSLNEIEPEKTVEPLPDEIHSSVEPLNKMYSIEEGNIAEHEPVTENSGSVSKMQPLPPMIHPLITSDLGEYSPFIENPEALDTFTVVKPNLNTPNSNPGHKHLHLTKVTPILENSESLESAETLTIVKPHLHKSHSNVKVHGHKYPHYRKIHLNKNHHLNKDTPIWEDSESLESVETLTIFKPHSHNTHSDVEAYEHQKYPHHKYIHFKKNLNLNKDVPILENSESLQSFETLTIVKPHSHKESQDHKTYLNVEGHNHQKHPHHKLIHINTNPSPNKNIPILENSESFETLTIGKPHLHKKHPYHKHTHINMNSHLNKDTPVLKDSESLESVETLTIVKPHSHKVHLSKEGRDHKTYSNGDEHKHEEPPHREHLYINTHPSPNKNIPILENSESFETLTIGKPHSHKKHPDHKRIHFNKNLNLNKVVPILENSESLESVETLTIVKPYSHKVHSSKEGRDHKTYSNGDGHKHQKPPHHEHIHINTNPNSNKNIPILEDSESFEALTIIKPHLHPYKHPYKHTHINMKPHLNKDMSVLKDSESHESVETLTIVKPHSHKTHSSKEGYNPKTYTNAKAHEYQKHPNHEHVHIKTSPHSNILEDSKSFETVTIVKPHLHKKHPYHKHINTSPHLNKDMSVLGNSELPESVEILTMVKPHSEKIHSSKELYLHKTDPNADKDMHLNKKPNINTDIPILVNTKSDESFETLTIVKPHSHIKQSRKVPHMHQKHPDEQSHLIDTSKLLMKPHLYQTLSTGKPHFDHIHKNVEHHLHQIYQTEEPRLEHTHPIVEPHLHETHPLIKPHINPIHPDVESHLQTHSSKESHLPQMHTIIQPHIHQTYPIVHPIVEPPLHSHAILKPDSDQTHQIIKPHIDTMVEPHLDTIVEPRLDQTYPIVEPHFDESHAIINPYSDHTHQIIEPYLDTIREPQSDQTYPIVVPPQEHLIIEPHVDSKHSIVEPYQHETNLIVDPNLKKTDPMFIENHFDGTRPVTEDAVSKELITFQQPGIVIENNNLQKEFVNQDEKKIINICELCKYGQVFQYVSKNFSIQPRHHQHHPHHTIQNHHSQHAHFSHRHDHQSNEDKVLKEIIGQSITGGETNIGGVVGINTIGVGMDGAAGIGGELGIVGGLNIGLGIGRIGKEVGVESRAGINENGGIANGTKIDKSARIHGSTKIEEERDWLRSGLDIDEELKMGKEAEITTARNTEAGARLDPGTGYGGKVRISSGERIGKGVVINGERRFGGRDWSSLGTSFEGEIGIGGRLKIGKGVGISSGRRFGGGAWLDTRAHFGREVGISGRSIIRNRVGIIGDRRIGGRTWFDLGRQANFRNWR